MSLGSVRVQMYLVLLAAKSWLSIVFTCLPNMFGRIKTNCVCVQGEGLHEPPLGCKSAQLHWLLMELR